MKFPALFSKRQKDNAPSGELHFTEYDHPLYPEHVSFTQKGKPAENIRDIFKSFVEEDISKGPYLDGVYNLVSRTNADVLVTENGLTSAIGRVCVIERDANNKAILHIKSVNGVILTIVSL